jgi:hypothetical protein
LVLTAEKEYKVVQTRGHPMMRRVAWSNEIIKTKFTPQISGAFAQSFFGGSHHVLLHIVVFYTPPTRLPFCIVLDRC